MYVCVCHTKCPIASFPHNYCSWQKLPLCNFLYIHGVFYVQFLNERLIPGYYGSYFTSVQPEGCAAKTAVPGLKVGQQILQVDSTSLHGFRHKETVMTIKSAFEGPMNKTITFIVLDNKQVHVCYVHLAVQMAIVPTLRTHNLLNVPFKHSLTVLK